MKFGEVLETLRSEGFAVSEWQLRYSWVSSNIPRPTKDLQGDFVFSEADLARLRLYLRHRRKPGKPKAIAT